MSIETMKQALEALEDACGGRCNAEYNPCFQREAASSLRQAIAEAEQAQLVTHCEAGPDYCQQCADEAQPVAWMHEMLRVQGCDGTWNCDPYMHGMYNGMEYMLAMVESREPVFRDAPDKWLNTLPPASITSAAYGIKGDA